MTNTFRSKREIPEDKPTRYYSSRQEKQVAKAIGGRQTPNSGATMFQKGDVTTNKFLIECKTQTKPKKQFTIKEEWFEKNKNECGISNKDYSAVVFNFGPDKENYYIIDEMLFNELLQHLEEIS